MDVLVDTSADIFVVFDHFKLPGPREVPENLELPKVLSTGRFDEVTKLLVVLFFLENVFLCQDRLARMNTKQKPGTPLVEN